MKRIRKTFYLSDRVCEAMTEATDKHGDGHFRCWSYSFLVEKAVIAYLNSHRKDGDNNVRG